MEPATKADLDQAVAALRLEWRHEMLAQVRWQAGMIVVQFIATIGATVAVLSFMTRGLVP